MAAGIKDGIAIKIVEQNPVDRLQAVPAHLHKANVWPVNEMSVRLSEIGGNPHDVSPPEIPKHEPGVQRLSLIEVFIDPLADEDSVHNQPSNAFFCIAK